MAFDSQLIHWPTVASFVEYLASVPRPAWCTGLTNHNTYRPNEAQWRGMTSMRSMQATYVAKGWTSGPHLFLAAQAPNPATTGIWQMTPITHQGTHAGPCNAHHLGIESVGDFDAHPPTELQYELLLAVNRAILSRWNIQSTSVNVHNECMPDRICPGQYLTGAQIRTDLSTPIAKAYRVRRVMVSQRQEGGEPYAGELQPGESVIVDKWYTNGMVHLASGLGFVKLTDLESV